jgi:choline dehydrogenase-like flavoprotein
VNETDRAKIQRALEILCRVLFAAGAKEVHTPVMGFNRMRRLADVDALAREKIPARMFDLSAWHPLGTCRMGNDPAQSVVNTSHETHDVKNLFITDGSSVPSSLGVNPQLTIMAMATRAAPFIAARVA